MKSNGRTLLAAVCCLMLILSAGCAALSSITAKQESLEERVKNYMQARFERKWDRAYDFLDSTSRERVTRESFVNRSRKLSNKGFTIENIKILPSGDEATVTVKTDVSYMAYTFKGVPQTQHWIKERGEWFVKFAEPRNPYVPQEKRK